MKKIFILIVLMIIISTIPAISKTTQESQNTIEYLNIEWWKNFKDDKLINNLLTVYQNNYDLKNAALKVQENEKLIKMQFASELPFINFSGDLSRDLQAPMQQFGSMRIPKYSQYNYYLPLTMSYEIDIWGLNHLKTKSIKEQLEIIKQAQRATYISLSSDFAASYFNLIKADKLLEIQEELVKTQENIVSLVSQKYKAGLCSINELLNEEKILTLLKEEKNKHKLTQQLLEESLKVYLVETQSKIERNSYDNVILLKNIPQQYSSLIVENRPDFKQEESNIKKLGFDVQIAKRELLPKFTIVGQIGLNAYNLSKLFKSSSQFLNIGILPNIDLFSGGRKIAYLKLKKYQYEEAINNYQKTILVGIKEVNSGILDFKTAIENYNESSNRLYAQSRIYNLAKDKKQIGVSGNIDVMYAKEAYLISKKDEVTNKINTIISTISLYKATGGVNLNTIENML